MIAKHPGPCNKTSAAGAFQDERYGEGFRVMNLARFQGLSSEQICRCTVCGKETPKKDLIIKQH